MPELPEVESIKRVLEPLLKGLTIQDIAVRRPEIIAHPDAENFCMRAVGKAIDHMERRGKFLSLCLGDSSRIILHLRMTGCLLLAPADHPEEKHTHLIFRLENGKELRFSDSRRFGRFWLLAADEKDTFSGMAKLGIEPTAEALSAQMLQDAFGKRKKAIKECLLDQSVVAGIGNIYSDEILFEARIHPSRPACSLTAAEWARLAQVIPERLDFFVEKNAVTPEEYLQMRGQEYRNTPYLRVYGHSKAPCPVCGKILCRTVIGGRSSVFCPGCQADEGN